MQYPMTLATTISVSAAPPSNGPIITAICTMCAHIEKLRSGCAHPIATKIDHKRCRPPSITAPTVATLHPTANLKGVKWYSVESVLDEAKVRDLIPKLIQAGAVGIIEYPLNKII